MQIERSHDAYYVPPSRVVDRQGPIWLRALRESHRCITIAFSRCEMMMGVGAVGNRVLCGFPNPCGRVLGVHRDGSVHALRRRASFERGRTDLAERRMTATLV